MNICYLIDVSPEKFTGGGQVHLLNLIQQVNFSRGAGSGFAGQIFASFSPNVLLRLLWMFYVIPQVIFHHLFKQKFDLIHAHSIPAMVSGKVLSVILGIPIVVTVHGYNEKHWMEKFVLTRVKYDTQITVSRNFLKAKNINKNVVYIPNGVDMSAFIFSKTKNKKQKTKNILFVGRKNDQVKGFKILQEAMKQVKDQIPGIELIVMAGGYSQKEVVESYQRADLFVLPSLSEGFPLTLLEAWAAKLPVVATKVGELPYLIKDGINGFLVDPGSAEKLALVIVKALKNRNLAKLGENGYNVAKNYKWSEVARSTLKVYESVVLSEQLLYC